MSYLRLYFALVRPILEYSSCAWNPYMKRDIVVLEKVQRRFTKFIPGMARLSYEQRLSHLNLQTLEVRRHRADLILLYKITHGLVDFPLTNLFELATNTVTRGHSLKLKPRAVAHLNVRHNFYSNRVVASWNQLPEIVVSALSISSFKSLLHDSGALERFPAAL